MKLRHLKSAKFFVIAFHFLLASCVSVNFDTTEARKSDRVTYKEPTDPYKKIDNPTVDMAWQNGTNGNAIAYLSECSGKVDPALQVLENENLAALTNIEIIERKNTSFNDREALVTKVNGQVDGVQVELNVVIFKKNGCNYTLSFVGRKKYIETDREIFKNFLESFKAP